MPEIRKKSPDDDDDDDADHYHDHDHDYDDDGSFEDLGVDFLFSQ